MIKIKYLLGLIGVLLIVNGCSGKRFVRLDTDQIILGQTTRQEVEQLVGDKYEESFAMVNGEKIDYVTYAYARASVGNVMPGKSQQFFFNREILIGQVYTSSMGVEDTDFDESKVAQIKKGKTNINQVRILLGDPAGEQIFPLTNTPDQRKLVYSYFLAKKGLLSSSILQKTLFITYNLNTGIVSDVAYISSGGEPNSE